jgi:hypothetical protein
LLAATTPSSGSNEWNSGSPFFPVEARDVRSLAARPVS